MSFVTIYLSAVARREVLIQSRVCEIMVRVIPFESSAMVNAQ